MNDMTTVSDPALKSGFADDSLRLTQRRTVKARSLAPASVFAITSGKGGVGKTNVAANLSAALAQKKRRVMVIDADLGLANLDLLLGVKPAYTLADFFSGAASLDDIVVPNRDGILLLPGASGVQEITSLNLDQKLALLTELDAMRRELDLVLVDTASGISDAVTYFTTAAQQIILVVTPEPSSMTDAYAVVKVLASAHHEHRFSILANHVSGEEQARRLFDTLSRTALRFLNASLDLLGWVPSDPQLVRAVARSRMVVIDAPDAPSSRAFSRIADRLIERAAAGVQVKGNVQFFLRRLLAAERGEQ
jgi:flagellar biosynthesis protein FlhG